MAASMLTNGVCVDSFEVLCGTSLQNNHVPNEVLSRISAYDALGSFVLGPWCLMLVGPLAAAIEVAQTLCAAGALLTAMNLATLASQDAGVPVGTRTSGHRPCRDSPDRADRSLTTPGHRSEPGRAPHRPRIGDRDCSDGSCTRCHRAIEKIRPERLWWWAGAAVAGIIAVPFIGELLPAQPQLWGTPVSLWRLWFVDMLPPVRMLDFVLGILVAQLVITGHWFKTRMRWGVILLVCSYIFALILPELPKDPLLTMFGTMAPFAIPLTLIVGAAAISDIEGRPSRLRNKRLVKLGDLAFAFYLVHWLVVHYGHMAVGIKMMSAPPAIAVILGMFAVALASAWMLYTFVEQPIMRRWSRPRRPQQAAKTASDATEPASDGTWRRRPGRRRHRRRWRPHSRARTIPTNSLSGLDLASDSGSSRQIRP